MSKLIRDVEALCDAHALKFKDCGKGHVQISGHGLLVNYWPESKKRTAHCVTNGRKETNCSPWDAVRLCLTDAKPGMKPKHVPKNRPQVDLKPAHTNPAGIKHLYDGELPPWDESLGEFQMHPADRLRVEAYGHEVTAMQLRNGAEELEEAS